VRQAAGLRPEKLATVSLGRSHRAKIGKARLQLAIDLMREVLQLPDTHRIGIVPGSDTGAFEMAMWTMLGARGVTTLAWESFGEGWVTDAVKQLKLEPTVMRADYGQLPDLDKVDFADDVLFTWNGTTSGVRVPDGEWIPDNREGLTFADATSAVFAYDIPWDKIDVATFSWQKVLGGEGAHGVLILGPRAVERLETYTPSWPLPKVFRLMAKGKLAEGIFKGETINTPRCWPSKTRSSRSNGPSRSVASKVSRRAPTPTPMRSTRSWPSVRGWATSRSTAAPARRPRSA
jgi:phosphoserine aminotransferase